MGQTLAEGYQYRERTVYFIRFGVPVARVSMAIPSSAMGTDPCA